MDERMILLYKAVKTTNGFEVFLRGRKKPVGIYNAKYELIQVVDYLSLPMEEFVPAIIRAGI